MSLRLFVTNCLINCPEGRKTCNRRRWISRDPIGEKGGINLYGYVFNDPTRLWDPFGLLDFEVNGSPAFQERVNRALALLKPLDAFQQILSKDGKVTIVEADNTSAPFSGDRITALDPTDPLFIGPDAPARQFPSEIPSDCSVDKESAVVLAHELGHSILDYPDQTTGPGVPNNVRDVEDAVRDGLGVSRRQTYHGQLLINPWLP